MLSQLFLDASGKSSGLDGTVALMCADGLELASNLPQPLPHKHRHDDEGGAFPAGPIWRFSAGTYFRSTPRSKLLFLLKLLWAKSQTF